MGLRFLLCLIILVIQQAIAVFLFTKRETAGWSPKGQVKLVLLWGFAECGNRKALRLRAQGVYFCK